MFRREVDIWFGFSHPHVVRLFDACHVGRPFFVCEYATNGTLVSYLGKNPDKLWSKLHEAALGVQYLHARGVVHGDLKGNNIVVGGDMKAKVTDFGLSSVGDSEEKTVVTGAWNWVAPELPDTNQGPTLASDVYSLGMCIVEALRVVEAVKSGKASSHCLPWRVADRAAMKYHATRGALPSRPPICEDSEWELVERMCVLDPAKQIKISTVVDELEKLTTGSCAILKKLERIQKNFEWRGKTGIDSSKHKLSPALIFSPVKAGGLGLQNIARALIATRCNIVERWLTGPDDVYKAAWHLAVHPGLAVTPYCCRFRPTTTEMIRKKMIEKQGEPLITAQCLGKLELWDAQTQSLLTLIPEPPNPKAVRPTTSKYESSYWINDETLGYATTANLWNLQLPQAADFLLHSPWNDNAAIVDNKGKPLRHKDFPMMRVCSVREIATYNGRDYEDCGIHCIKIKPPLSDVHSRSKYPAKIKSWCCSVLNNLPWNIWNIPEEDPKPMALPHLKQSLRWTMQDTGENPVIAAYRSSQPDHPVFHMTKSLDGWTWKLAWIDGDYRQCRDCRELQAWERTVGISFTSNPRISIYPWHTHPETYAAHVAKALRNQRTKRSKLHSYYNLTPLIGRLQARASISPWGQAALTQSPEQLWNREGLYTDYQNWTIYRIALGVLNLRHDGWPQDRQCPGPECSCMEETVDHVIWNCAKAQTAWRSWISLWNGEPSQVHQFRSAVASRVAPPITIAFLSIAHQCVGRWTYQHTRAVEI